MKLKSNYVLRQVADIWVVLPLAEENLNLHGMLTLNNAGSLLWKALERGCGRQELVEELTAKYEVSHEQSAMDVDEFLQKLREIGCLEAE